MNEPGFACGRTSLLKSTNIKESCNDREEDNGGNSVYESVLPVSAKEDPEGKVALDMDLIEPIPLGAERVPFFDADLAKWQDLVRHRTRTIVAGEVETKWITKLLCTVTNVRHIDIWGPYNGEEKDHPIHLTLNLTGMPSWPKLADVWFFTACSLTAIVSLPAFAIIRTLLRLWSS